MEPLHLAPELANIIAAYANGGAQPTIPAFVPATVLSETAGDGERQIAGEVAVHDHGEAALSLDGYWGELSRREHVRVQLADQSIIDAGWIHSARHRAQIEEGKPPLSRTTFELSQWKWQTSAPPIAWVGTLFGRDFGHWRNLEVSGHGCRTCKSLRLEGNATWYLGPPVETRGGYTRVAVVEDAPGLDLDALTCDFHALEFIFGTALRLDCLVGVNSENRACAAQGLSFGYRFRPGADCSPPLPDDRRTPWMAWPAVAFPLVARALRASEANPTMVAVCGYVDSTIGHVDGQYLFAQVALEALADRLTPKKQPVVHDKNEWKKWIGSLLGEIEKRAVDPRAVNDLRGKLAGAWRPTTSHLVQDLLSAHGITPPAEALDEIEGRNTVAHTFAMNEEGSYDFEREAKRIKTIQSLLAATLLRNLGYEGALAGWILGDDGRAQAAEWFPSTARARTEAERRWEIAATRT